MKVLIVDDSKAVCNGIQKMLTGIPGVKISGQARNGKDAITSISELKPDVVILDIRLPDLSGIEVLKDIREKNLLPGSGWRIPVPYVCRSTFIICRTRPGTMSPCITSGPRMAARSISRSHGREKPSG